MRPCPACGRRIQDAAPRCHFCNAPVPHAPRAQHAPAGRPPAVERPSQFRLGAALVIGLIVALVIGALLAILR